MRHRVHPGERGDYGVQGPASGAYSAHPIQIGSRVVQIASTRARSEPLTLHSPIRQKIPPEPQFPLCNTGTPRVLCEG